MEPECPECDSPETGTGGIQTGLGGTKITRYCLECGEVWWT